MTESEDALHLEAPATPGDVGRLRRATRRWLRELLGDDEDLVDNLTLAVSEALENAAEHAYASHDAVGTMTLSGQWEAASGSVVISVSDTGRWRTPTDSGGLRGRGLEMISELAAAHTVTPGPHGTTVTLRHPTRRSHDVGQP